MTHIADRTLGLNLRRTYTNERVDLEKLQLSFLAVMSVSKF